MIVFNSRVRELLRQPVTEAFHLVRVKDLYLTTWHQDIALSNGQVYESKGLILSLDAPKLESVVDREQYKMMLSDPSFALGDTFDTGLIGAPVEVRIGFIDYYTEQPDCNIENTFLTYKGIVDGPSYEIKTDSIGAATATIACASPMNDLAMIRAFYTSKEYVSQRYPSDTSYDQIYIGSGPVNLKWGKI